MTSMSKLNLFGTEASNLALGYGVGHSVNCTCFYMIFFITVLDFIERIFLYGLSTSGRFQMLPFCTKFREK